VAVIRAGGTTEVEVVGKISDDGTYVFGYDAQEGEYGDLVSKGIMDPNQGCPHRPPGCALYCRTVDNNRSDGC
jgi:hypothetical protein